MRRLLHTTTLHLQTFIGDDVPPYAILSHRWVDGELTFQEWMCLDAAAKAKRGYKKIISACQQAIRDCIEWIWVDTICINKESSAELSEAINSMFKWYW